MPDRVRTLVAVAIILGVPLLVIFVIGFFISRRSVVSPVPEQNPIQIIILTPAPTPTAPPPVGNGTM